MEHIEAKSYEDVKNLADTKILDYSEGKDLFWVSADRALFRVIVYLTALEDEKLEPDHKAYYMLHDCFKNLMIADKDWHAFCKIVMSKYSTFDKEIAKDLQTLSKISNGTRKAVISDINNVFMDMLFK